MLKPVDTWAPEHRVAGRAQVAGVLIVKDQKQSTLRTIYASAVPKSTGIAAKAAREKGDPRAVLGPPPVWAGLRFWPYSSRVTQIGDDQATSFLPIRART
jgi:hypothetical protein